jgi:outer membrane protein OmpA-like peptidoglycan-associated protein
MSFAAAFLGPLLLSAAAPSETDGCPGDLVFFPSGSAQLDADAQAKLDGMWQWLGPMVEAGAWLHLWGHADDVGPAASNLKLSRRRAEAVAAHYRRHGAPPERLRVRAFGEAEPLAPLDPGQPAEAARRQNRRVQIWPEMPREVFHRFFPPGGAIC